MHRRSVVLLVTLACFLPSAWPQAGTHQKAGIITFDVPGAGTGAGQGTLPIGIIQGGWIAGTYIDANNVSHGFLRTPFGAIIPFDPPGAGKEAGQGTIEVHGLNPALEIVGTYLDANNVYHGFVRSSAGRFTSFDCPGAGSGSYQGTASHGVNQAGLISAEYLDANGVWHGCIRDREGNMSSYDPPDAGSVPGSGQGTYPAIFSGINPEGAIIGEYADVNYVTHAYLRAPDGAITEFDDPAASTETWQGSYTLGINAAGWISGGYIDANNASHGYLRSRDGTFTEVDAPGAGDGIYQGTNNCALVSCFGGINPAGTTTNAYVDANNVAHGLLRTLQGKFTTFDAPGAGTGAWQGTQPTSINPEGAITGFYADANNVYHGFLRLEHGDDGWSHTSRQTSLQR